MADDGAADELTQNELEALEVLEGEDLNDIGSQVTEKIQSVSKLTQLPHTRIRNMMKLDCDLKIASQESVFVITKATELFIQFLTEKCHSKTQQGKRKTVQKRDFDAALLDEESFLFLDGAMD